VCPDGQSHWSQHVRRNGVPGVVTVVVDRLFQRGTDFPARFHDVDDPIASAPPQVHPTNHGVRRHAAVLRRAIDADTRTASPDTLGISEQTCAHRARFTTTQRDHLDPDTLHKHRLVLAISGQATRSLGANRRRGLGWVSITCTHVEPGEAAATAFLQLGAA